jgi:hypothetical protein
MPATVTLSTTTLTYGVGPAAGRIALDSTDGITPNIRLFIDGELMKVISLDVAPWVNVARGVDGTSGASHPSEATVYIGRADQFYSQDPVGRPDAAIRVSPYINAINGRVWFAQGDANTTANRWWQLQTTTYGIGPLGVRTATVDLTEST